MFEVLKPLSLAGLVILAGCAGGLGGLMGEDGSLSFTAGSIDVSESAVSDSGFSVKSNKEVSFEQSFDVQGQSKKVVMNAHMVHLTRSYEGAPFGNVVILSLPQISILGQKIDVAQQLSPTDLVTRAQGQSGELSKQQKIRELSVQVLGGQRTVEVHRGTAKQDGQSAKVKIYSMTFSHEGDTILAVGTIPQAANESASSVTTLFEGIRYG